LEFMDLTAFDPYLLRGGLYLIKRLIRNFFRLKALCITYSIGHYKLVLLAVCPIDTFYWTLQPFSSGGLSDRHLLLDTSSLFFWRFVR
jgi:hypothetical protein